MALGAATAAPGGWGYGGGSAATQAPAGGATYAVTTESSASCNQTNPQASNSQGKALATFMLETITSNQILFFRAKKKMNKINQ
jgi:hypothetical protein